MRDLDAQLAQIKQELDQAPEPADGCAVAGAWAETAGRRRAAGLTLLGIIENLRATSRAEQPPYFEGTTTTGSWDAVVTIAENLAGRSQVVMAWHDDPGQDPAQVRDVTAVCPRCGEPALNPVPVRRPAPNTAEALCTCGHDHLWIVRWTDFDPDEPDKEATA